MRILLIAVVVIAAVISCDALNWKINCATHFPNKNDRCVLQEDNECVWNSTDRGCWKDSIAIYTCQDGEQHQCDRPCFNKKCDKDGDIPECDTLAGQECMQIMFSKCRGNDGHGNCGFGKVYKRLLCKGGETTCWEECCCRSCPKPPPKTFTPDSKSLMFERIKPTKLCRNYNPPENMCPLVGHP